MSPRRPSTASWSVAAFCAVPVASVSFATSFAEFDFAESRDARARRHVAGAPDDRRDDVVRTPDSQTEPL
jgi:methyl coenzyme M reductase alpha subunit